MKIEFKNSKKSELIPKPGSSDIWIMNSDGSNKMPSTSSKEKDGPIGWSSGGFDWSPNEKIAYLCQSVKYNFIPKIGTVREEENDIWIMDADGSNKRVLLRIPHKGKIDDLAWSPDGSKIAFVWKPNIDVLATEEDKK